MAAVVLGPHPPQTTDELAPLWSRGLNAATPGASPLFVMGVEVLRLKTPSQDLPAAPDRGVNL
jgi:hypothetical protein